MPTYNLLLSWLIPSLSISVLVSGLTISFATAVFLDHLPQLPFLLDLGRSVPESCVFATFAAVLAGISMILGVTQLQILRLYLNEDDYKGRLTNTVSFFAMMLYSILTMMFGVSTPLLPSGSLFLLVSWLIYSMIVLFYMASTSLLLVRVKVPIESRLLSNGRFLLVLMSATFLILEISCFVAGLEVAAACIQWLSLGSWLLFLGSLIHLFFPLCWSIEVIVEAQTLR